MNVDISLLKQKSKEYRKNIIKMIYNAKAGHPGGSLSVIDILTVLYLREMQLNIDKLILSKGHAAPALYCILEDLGYFNKSYLLTYRQINSILQGHPDINKTPGVDATTGLLGQGLSIGVGLALGKKYLNHEGKVYVILGDGELNEGQIWEAAASAKHYNLNNLIAIIDKNGLSQQGKTTEIMNLEPLDKKWEAFGWNVIEADGHNFQSLINAINKAKNENNKPSVIIASTIKGKGVTFMENKVEWHSKIINEEEYLLALKEINSL